MKICSKCKINKEFKDFVKNKNAKDGLFSYCKSCNNEYYRNYNQKPEVKKKIVQRDKKRYSTIEYKNFNKNYNKQRRIINTNYRLAGNLRNRLRIAIYNQQKNGSAIKDLGCSVEEFKKHLESKFQDGMTWENWGAWHIDHIKPLSSFNLSNREEFLKACNYNNMQPLWAKDNLAKGSK